MTDKVTLSSISPTNSVTTAAATINSNNAAIVAAMDNTLSLNGLAPNQMGSNLDMNSNQILNLPAPVAANSPARLVDILSNPTLTLTIPPIGTSGSVVGLLNTSNTFSGANTFSGSNTFSTGNTFSGATTFNSPVTISSTGQPLIVTGASPGSGEVLCTLFDTGMGATNQIVSRLGVASSSFNTSQWGFYFAGTGSANNHGWLGMFAADHTINWDGNGFVGINTGTSVLTKRFAVGSNFTVDDSGNVIATGLGTFNQITLNGLLTGQDTSTYSPNTGAYIAGNFSASINAVIKVNQAAPTTADLYFLTGNSGVLSTSLVLGNTGINSFYGPFGYAVGAGKGGTVTQATNKSTAVTLNTPTGQITMNNASLAATTIVSFTLNNTAIAATDVLILNHVSGGTVGSYTLNAQCGSGSAIINIRNNTAGGLSEAIVISYVLIKGSTN